ncbi:prion-like-(Q/N-rich) domain-bearing protein 25 [Microplitis demolitor]|uniref:prion-like-(Q/N-rich) domain-bearing protein 25 n=1 Tax=Microplitis demolitor TaxID=69319 RepID=UPI0004CC91A2|nr:prion-like-(Q/N-rich) domain-bearing protein 25 [Microplitis demolitor]
MIDYLFILILISLSSINADGNESNYQCANHRSLCNPYKIQPCCDEKDVCKNMGGYFSCINQVILGISCRTTYECAVRNSQCIGNICQCSPLYIPSSTNKCKRRSLGRPCNDDSHCKRSLNHTVCSQDKRCVCGNYYYPTIEDICVRAYNSFCVENEPCAQESYCINRLCQCKSNQVYRNFKCVPKDLGESCKNHTDCYGVRFAKCSKHQKCICDANYLAMNKTMCQPSLGGFCLKNEQCVALHSICIQNKCQCHIDYSPVPEEHRCVRTSLGKFCESNADCKVIKNSKCSGDVCVCNDDNFTFNRSTCIPIINGFCSSDESCEFHGFHCVDNKCQCKPNFVLVSPDTCIEKLLLFSCNDTSECSEPWHSFCSIDKKCVCNLNNIALSRSSCSPILAGYCWKNDQCMAGNSICVNYRCACKPNFIAVSKNYCVSA